MVTNSERLMVAAFIASSVAAEQHGVLDRGMRGELLELVSDAPFDVDGYNARWSSLPDEGGLFARRLRAAREWFGRGSLVCSAAPSRE